MKFSDLDLNGTYTYADYLKWNFDERVEIIKGKIFKMAMPSEKHQRVSSNIHGYFWSYFKSSVRERGCQVYHPPFDVRLVKPPHLRKATDKSIYTVIQPDITVVCDRNKIDSRGCLGAPDLVVEIVSPGSVKKDLKDKKEVYEFAGVKEYWIVYPLEETILVYLLNENGVYVVNEPFTIGDEIKVSVFPDLMLNLADVFSE
jgi:Uma2 family endonuclease